MIIYQIYPRSFMDTNGDGIGDLKGIAEKIPYIADLGAEMVWISPFFTSPMRDFGYDVSDYRGVDPIFCTINDFDNVIKVAHEHGLKIMIDQVWGHCSDFHPWFQESRKDRKNDKHDWFIWADPKPDGFFPNNWLSIFGGPAWTWNGARRQYFLHHFLSTQPALNLRHPDVFKAMMEDSMFWIERGVDGFRVDAVPHFLADEKLRDNPPVGSGKDDSFTNATNPRKMQENIYTQSLPELMPWIEDVRAYFRKRGSEVIMLAEIMTKGMKLAGETVHGKDRMDTAYTGDLMHTDWSAKSVKKTLNDLYMYFDKPGKMCWSLGNHDISRFATRVQKQNNPDEFWRFVVAWFLCLEGYLCWYQGDELGLEDADIPFDQIQDPFGKTFWPDFKRRDGCRTPMPWHFDKPEAGFTTGKSWLPIPGSHQTQAVDVQEGDKTSKLEYVRSLMKLRRDNPALLNGEMRLLALEEGMVGFEREVEGQRVVCLFNFDEKKSYPIDCRAKKVLFQSNVVDGEIQPRGVYIAEV